MILRELYQYTDLKNRYELYTTTKRDKPSRIYKYMSIEVLRICLGLNDENNQSILFSEPSNWPDKYEERFYMADYSKLNIPENMTPKLYACCFTYNEESDAAWKVYRNYNTKDPNEGLCAKVTIKRDAFTKQLAKYYETTHKIYEGYIDYSLSLREINTLHQSSIEETNEKNLAVVVNNEQYNEIFGNNNFELKNYLTLLSIKRTAFKYENEYRYFIIDNKDLKAGKRHHKKKTRRNKTLCPKINWADVIESIKIDDQYPDDEFRYLRTDIANALHINKDLITKVDINKMGDYITIEKKKDNNKKH